MTSVRRVLESRAESASVRSRVQNHNGNEQHVLTTARMNLSPSHGAPLTSSMQNEFASNAEPLLFVRRQRQRTPPIRNRISPPGLIRQRSNDGIPRSHGLGTEERPGTAETSEKLNPLPPDESLPAANLTPLNISRRNSNLFQLSSGSRLPKKHVNSGLGNVLAAITSKPPKTLTSITSDLNGAAAPDSPTRRSDCSALSKAFCARNSPKGTSCSDINAESDSSGASSSQSDPRNFPRRPDSSRSDTRKFPRRSDTVGGLANAINGLANALSTLNLHKAAPLLSITSESKSDGSVDTITDSTPRQSEEITIQSDDTPRQSDITISLKKSGNTPRKIGVDVNPPNAKFQLSLDISNIVNKGPVAPAEAKSAATDPKAGAPQLKFGLSRAGSTFTTDNGMVISERGIAKDPPKSARAPKVSSSRAAKPKKMKAEFILLKELGRGAGGVVYKAIHVRTFKIVAIKKVRMASQAKKKQVMREVQALFRNLIPLSDKCKGSPCRNIVTFHGAFTNPETLHMSIVLEFMDWGVLRQLVKKGTRCTEGQLAYIGRSILNGLIFIHSCHQLHRDIKPDNVLVNSKGQIKISDFGITRDMNPQDSKDLAETFTGTVMYMSPERLAGKYYSYSSDIWSFGLSIATLALGKFPFDSKKGFWGIIGVLNNNPVPKLPEDEFSAEACDFVAQCLRKDSSKRMSAADLLRHSFLRQSCGAEKFLQLFPPSSEAEKLSNARKIVAQLAQHYKKQRRGMRRAVSAPAASITQHAHKDGTGEDAPSDRCFANLAKQVGVSARKLKHYFERRMNMSKSSSKRNVRLPSIHLS